MIFQQWTNSRQMALDIAECNICSDVVGVPSDVEEREFVLCECDFSLKQFYSTSNDDHKNDKVSFLLRRVINSDLIQFTLEKDGVLVAILDDNIYGEFFDFGSFADFPDQIGFILDFQKIGLLLGVGDYQVVINKDIIGVETVLKSVEYNLCFYDPCAADKTVRFDWYQNGCIMSSDVKHVGLNWFNSLRVPGKFWRRTPKESVLEHKAVDRSLTQVTDEIVTTFKYESHLITMDIYKKMIYDLKLANSIFINDYNIDNPEIYRAFPVISDGIPKPEFFTDNTKFVGRMQFKNRTENDLKRNFP